MKLSTRSRYGVRLLTELALEYQKGPVQLGIISKREGISEKYLGQLIIQMKGTGFITSSRGKNGGYMLAKKPKDITLREIVEKLEGDICLVDCTKDNTECDRSTFCITREIWKKLSDDMASSLEKINLQTLVDRIRKSKNYPEYQI
ncbi:MAG TPA: Rrf2 family transcriptional regulator [Spirochaetota bacterium]|mgnify:FL=1|nr:Rrf2 family transcriptional regulator [Spirochaetota bacterium]HOF32593.1 Rrf2 family transcriptional regulator [Spirochaetota bacterium]HOR43217.1 Rrf2 family transcriptional regulator [Spirochaetota bacterium]HOU84740.1 Rrf2 family transcriptional regulator [Spirochaetota bacterium]HPK55556.1 Rrf2 family transcriptional regulator [Spirochaetota bacterium]